MDGKLALYRESELYKIMVKEVAVRRFFLGVRRSPQSPPPLDPSLVQAYLKMIIST